LAVTCRAAYFWEAVHERRGKRGEEVLGREGLENFICCLPFWMLLHREIEKRDGKCEVWQLVGDWKGDETEQGRLAQKELNSQLSAY